MHSFFHFFPCIFCHQQFWWLQIGRITCAQLCVCVVQVAKYKGGKTQIMNFFMQWSHNTIMYQFVLHIVYKTVRHVTWQAVHFVGVWSVVGWLEQNSAADSRWKQLDAGDRCCCSWRHLLTGSCQQQRNGTSLYRS